MINQEQILTSQDHRYLNPKATYTAPEEREAELFVRIKKSSEDYHQGLDPDGKPCIFKIDNIRHGFLSFRLNSNNYSCHDLSFFVKDAKTKLIPLTGGTRR